MYQFCPFCTRPLALTEMAGRLRPACIACGFAQFPDPKVVVGVVASRDGKVLLQQRRHSPGKGLWSFPSGYVDAGERVEDAALREVQEEVQVEVQLDGLLGVFSEPGNPVIFIAYRGTIVSGEPAPGHESLDVGLFPPDQMPPLAFPHDAEVLEDWKHAVRPQ